MKKISGYFVLLSFLFLISSYGYAQSLTDKQKLVLAVQPSLSSAEILEKSKPLEAVLEVLMPNTDIVIYTPMSYAAAVEAIRFEHAQAALMGAWPAALAVRLASAEVPLAEVREVIHGENKTEAAYYFSYWVVLKDKSFQKLDELKGKNACFPSPVSSSGYLAPLGKLVELGLVSKAEGKEADPKEFFGNILFGGGYQQCWNALQSGQVDVTVIAGDVPEKLYREVLDSTQVLAEQGPIPSHALVVSSKLSEPLRSEFLNALEKAAKENRELMRGFISGIFTGFERTSAEKHLQGLNDSMEKTGLKFTEKLG